MPSGGIEEQGERRTMTVSILVDIVLGNRLTPRGSTLELDVVYVDSGVDDVWEEVECKQIPQNEQGLATEMSRRREGPRD